MLKFKTSEMHINSREVRLKKIICMKKKIVTPTGLEPAKSASRVSDSTKCARLVGTYNYAKVSI